MGLRTYSSRRSGSGIATLRPSAYCLLLVIACALLSGCSRAKQGIFRLSTHDQVTAQEVRDAEAAFAFARLEVLAESPFPFELAGSANNHFRVLGFTSSGGCDFGCPPAVLYVVVWSGDGMLTDQPRIFRVDGMFSPELVRVVEYHATLLKGSFLRFLIRSNRSVDRHELYEVAVSAEGASVTRLPETPPPT